MNRKARNVCLLSFLFVSLYLSFGHASNGRHPLFFIERSKNGNIVQYDLRVTEEGHPLGKEAVVVYWIMENGDKKELSIIQKKLAYGIESQERVGDGVYEIVLTALKDRKIQIRKTGDAYSAFVEIAGQECVLESVYVESRERVLGPPRVLHVDLFGKDCQTDHPTKERILPP